MTKDTAAIAINLYVVPLTAALLTFIGWLQGGTEILILDIILYSLTFFLIYSITYFFINFYKNETIKFLSLILYISILLLYTYSFCKYMFILLIPLYLHMFMKTRKSEQDINLNNSILSFIISELPSANKIFLATYIILTFILVLILN